MTELAGGVDPLELDLQLFGGEAETEGSPPCDDTGDRIGEGDRFAAAAPLPPRDESEVRPARWIDSRLPATPEGEAPCSAWTTSAKEMKLRRRTSVESSEP